ncbi:MAG: hypothetical protein P9M14_09135 [Candidatus Alcyoniella australis]|nr:hypothetical protein [Candidatus Alcyoniella australis]
MVNHRQQAPELLKRVSELRSEDWTAPTIIQRGKRYFEHGHVGPLLVRPNEITTAVSGSGEEPYQVYFLEGADGFIALCECPFVRDPFCKHLVAVIYACRAAIAGELEWRTDQGASPQERIESVLARSELQRLREDPFKALELDGYLVQHDLGLSRLGLRARLDYGARIIEQTNDVLLFGRPPSAWPLGFVRALVRWTLRDSEASDTLLSGFFHRMFSFDRRLVKELEPAIIAACFGPPHRRRVAEALRNSLRIGQGLAEEDRESICQLCERLDSA